MSSELQRVNTPDGGVQVETVSETHTTYLVDAEQEGLPTPRMFHDLGVAGAKLVVLSSVLPSTYAAEAERLYSDVCRLKRMMARERLDDERDVRDLCMGDLGVLPEVEKEREQRHRDDCCPECGQPYGGER